MEAYLETLPPKIRDAIKAHQVLVGMNREMVMAAKGRPPKKIREKDGEIEYEEWIYGEPPQDVDFVRLVGDEVVRLESMKVDGEKIIHTEQRSGSRAAHRSQGFIRARGSSAQCALAAPPGRGSRYCLARRRESPASGPPPDPLGQDGPPRPNKNVGASVSLSRSIRYGEISIIIAIAVLCLSGVP